MTGKHRKVLIASALVAAAFIAVFAAMMYVPAVEYWMADQLTRAGLDTKRVLAAYEGSGDPAELRAWVMDNPSGGIGQQICITLAGWSITHQHEFIRFTESLNAEQREQFVELFGFTLGDCGLGDDFDQAFRGHTSEVIRLITEPGAESGSGPDPETLEQQRRGAHPIVDRHSFLVGGTVDGKWLSTREMAKHVRGGERYKTYWGGEFRGIVVGSKPDRNLIVRTEPEASVIAVACDWDPAPRKASEEKTDRREFAKDVRSILKDKGLQKSPVRVFEAFKVDLEGDGHSETILTVASKEPWRYAVGEYSLVALRKVVKGKPVVSVVTGDFRTSESDGGVPLFYEVGGVWDLDGDGVLEVVVTCMAPVLESYWTEVYKLKEGRLRLVAAVRPNYDYKIE